MVRSTRSSYSNACMMMIMHFDDFHRDNSLSWLETSKVCLNFYRVNQRVERAVWSFAAVMSNHSHYNNQGLYSCAKHMNDRGHSISLSFWPCQWALVSDQSSRCCPHYSTMGSRRSTRSSLILLWPHCAIWCMMMAEDWSPPCHIKTKTSWLKTSKVCLNFYWVNQRVERALWSLTALMIDHSHYNAN